MSLYDIATVAHRSEWDMLRLQARSMRRWLDPKGVGRIWVVLNEPGPAASAAELLADLGEAYGDRWTQVQVLGRDEVAPGLEAFPGYQSQQLLKLRLSRLVSSRFYVVLDAKNALIGPVGHDYFFAGVQPKARFEHYADSFQHYIAEAYYGMLGTPPERRSFDLPAMMTPFTFPTSLVEAAIGLLETAFGRSIEECFEQIFAPRQLLSEFLLYSTGLVHAGADLHRIYSAVERMAVTLWKDNALGLAALQAVLGSASAQGIQIVGLHRERRAQMSAAEIAYLTEFFRAREVLSKDMGFEV